MDAPLLYKLLELAEPYYPSKDPSHDYGHICRVFAYAHHLWIQEGGDFDIIAAGAIFHDCLNYPKKDPRSPLSAEHSAQEAEKILKGIPKFPRAKIGRVTTCILEHSFSKGIKPKSLESMIVQDADRLESTGIIALMRTFGSCGAMGRTFFNWQDPFCESDRLPDAKRFGLDLVYSRLLKVSSTMNTKSAKKLAKESDTRIKDFLSLLKEETKFFPTRPDYWEGKL